MAELEEEAYKILNSHCIALVNLSDELQIDLIKLYREHCTEKDKVSEDQFLESCLRALRAMMVMHSKQERLGNPRLN